MSRREYAYLKVPPDRDLRSCVGLVLAGMAARAKVGVGGLEEAVELLARFPLRGRPDALSVLVRRERRARRGRGGRG